MWYYNRLTGERLANPVGFCLSTNLEPPVVGENQCAIFANGGWQVVPDFRGIQFYRKSGGYSVFLKLGDVPGDDLVRAERPSKFHAWADNGWQLDANLVRADLLNRVADYRRSVEVGGIAVAGIEVDTSRNAQAMLTQAYTSMHAGFIQSVDWKGDSGWHVLSIQHVTALAQALASHVEGCFTKEKTISMQIAALDDASLNNFDIAAAWAAL